MTEQERRIIRCLVFAVAMAAHAVAVVAVGRNAPVLGFFATVLVVSMAHVLLEWR